MVTGTFTLTERAIWVEVIGLPTCAWTPSAYKKWLQSLASNGIESDENEDVSANGEDKVSDVDINTGDYVPGSYYDNSINKSTTNKPDVILNQDNNSTDAADKSISNENKHFGDEKVREENSSNSAKPNDGESVDTTSKPPGFNGVSESTKKTLKKKQTFDGSLLIVLDKYISIGNTLGYDMQGMLVETQEAIGNGGSHTQNLATKRMDILKNIASIEKIESLDLAQKSRRHWCAHGDDNTYSKFNAFNGISISQPSPHLKSLSSSQRESLSSDFSDLEIKDVVWSCSSNKSPGPDGFSFRFIKRFWDLVKDDICGFITDFRRQILDGPLMINEIIAWCKKRKRKAMIFKVNFEKAFDSISWNYIYSMMNFMGFDSKWIAWIQACLSSSYTLVLVNGSPTSEFKIGRGLRQGDPLSLFLFIIGMEGLHAAIEDAISSSLFCCLSIGSQGLHISHFLYADDALFVGEWYDQNINNLITQLEVERLASGMGCSASSLPFTYLGLPVGVNMNNEASWYHVIDKIKKRLSNWKVNMLSSGGCPTLIKSVLGSLDEDRKISWIKWKHALNTKEKGGLSISSVQALNSALILKWKWRFLNSSKSLWVQIIKGIHGDYDGLLTSPFQSFNHGVWVNIVRSIYHLHDNQVIPRNIMTRKLNNGRSIKFWEDDWHENGPWKFKYPRLYALESNHSCLVADRYSQGHWSWQWRRNLRDGKEGSQLAALMETLNQLSLDSNPDYWTWEADTSKKFMVQSARRIIDNHALPSGLSPTRWCRYVPSKVNIFAWRLLLNRLPTRINIMERGIDIPLILCSICNSHQEDFDHLFLHCEVASQIWHKIRIWLDNSFPTCSRVSDIWKNLDAQQQTKKAKIIMEVIILSTVWAIWRFQNNMIFNNSKF
ncbi:RNA-directed DNA polymerase, eukaryota, reverse transcriptase zinc-binding domain protein [Tanacetum coccineum]